MRVLVDLKDFGTGWANKSGAITLPAQARQELGLPTASHWHVMGSPALRFAILVAPRQDARDTLEFLLRPEEEAHDRPA